MQDEESPSPQDQQPPVAESQDPAGAPLVQAAEAEVGPSPQGGQDEELAAEAASRGLDQRHVPYVAAFLELRKWVDMSDAQYATLHAHWEAFQGRPAMAVK